MPRFPEFDSPAESGVRAEKDAALSPPVAEALAKRLNAVTPWHVKVDVFVTERGGVGHKIRSWRWMSWEQGEEPGSDQQTAVSNLLSAVQSYMSEKTKRAWPGEGALPELKIEDNEAPRRRDLEEHANELFSRLPLPGIAIEDGLIRLWYGDETKPVLELEPIRRLNVPG